MQEGVSSCSRPAVSRRVAGSIMVMCMVALSVVFLFSDLAWPKGALLAQAAPESEPAQNEGQVVERWRGTVYRETTYVDSFASCVSPWVCQGDFHRLERQSWDIEVYADGYARGYVRTALLDYSYRQTKTNINCGPVAETNYTYQECQYAVQLVQPNGLVFVEGVREIDPLRQVPVLRLENRSMLEECQATWTARGIHSRTGAVIHQQKDQVCNGFAVPQVYTIEAGEDGRAPRIDMTRTSTGGSISSATWGYLIGLVEEPFLELDRELLERSVFLDQVPVEELFTANMNWNSPGGGWVTWQWAEDGPERVGPTAETQIPKPINQGTQGVGNKELRVQGKGSLGQTSDPEIVLIPIVPPPQWSGDPAEISATKVEGAVVYKNSLKFPEPSFEGTIAVPAAIPWFGGKRMGIAETQGVFEWEAYSTSEGQGKLSGQTGFEAMGGTLLGALGGRARVVLNPSGVEIPEGGMDFSIAGKLESDPQPLLQVVPALNPVLGALQSISPQAAGFIADRANAKLEVQPQLEFGFNFITQNDEIQFQNAEAKPAIGFKTTVELNLIKDVLAATAAIGGEIATTFQVPAPYFKEAALKGLVQAQIVLYRYAWSGERAWSVIVGSGAAAAGDQVVGEQVWESHHGSEGWRLLERTYLDDPNYARWAAEDPVIQSGLTTHEDALLVENIFPQANPSMHIWIRPSNDNDNNYPQVAQAWAHDTPLGGEIAYARNHRGPFMLLDEDDEDDHDDLAPKIVFLSDGGPMVLWQRMNTPFLPDFEDDNLADYLSSWQIAAQRTGARQFDWLSDRETLNYRHSLGATHDGALAVWVNNPANQILGDAANPDHILFAHYQVTGNARGEWSETTSVLSDVVGLLNLDLATAAHSGVPLGESTTHLAALVYSLDLDNDLATDADRELFYVTWDGDLWSEPIQLTDNNVPDDLPQLVLDENGAPSLVWRQDGRLKFLHGSWQGTPVDLDLPGAAERPDYTLVQGYDGKLALSWQEAEPEDTRIGYAIYDAEHDRWSLARMLIPPVPGNEEGDEDGDGGDDGEGDARNSQTTMATAIAAAFMPPSDDGREPLQLRLIYQLAHVALVTRTVNIEGVDVAIPNVPQVGQHDLRVATLPLAANLTVTPDDLSAPAPNLIQAVIHNTGDLAVRDVPVVLYTGPADPVSGTAEGTTQTLPLLVAGAAATLTFELPASALDDALFRIHIDPEETMHESNRADNMAYLGADLEIMLLPAYYSSQGVMVRARVSQYGPLYTSLTVPAALSLEGPDGPVVGGSQIGFPLTPTTAITISAFISPTQLGPGRHPLFWTVDPDRLLGKNTQYDRTAVTTIMVLPDLAGEPDRVYFDAAPGDSAAFGMEVQNLGNWPSNGGVVQVFDGLPGRPGVHSLLRLPLPTIEPGEHAELAGTLQLASLPAAQTGLSAIYIQLDADGEVDEINENNNLIGVGAVLETADVVEVENDFRLHVPMVQR